MAFHFEKMHANGDDFILVDARLEGMTFEESFIRLLGDRQRGIGFNQLCVLSACDDADARLMFWNADGSELDACGSATRGAAARLMREMQRPSVTVRTARGLLSCVRRPDGRIAVDMGRPSVHWAQVPLARAMDTLELALPGAPGACSMGNPHCTFFVDDAEAINLAQYGPEIERHPLFPQGTNVHFVQIIDRRHIRLRIWERGAGVSAGSGSCSCGAVVNGIRRGLLESNVMVHCDGGDLEVSWNGADGVLLAGPVETIFQGFWLETPKLSPLDLHSKRGDG